jgi:hypothetical protein
LFLVQARIETESLRLDLDRCNFELARLRDEANADCDAGVQRKALHAQMARYPELLEENEALKRENHLLVETAENSQVLREQVN